LTDENGKLVCHGELHKAILAANSDLRLRITQGDIYEARRSKCRELVLFFIQTLGIAASLGGKMM